MQGVERHDGLLEYHCYVLIPLHTFHLLDLQCLSNNLYSPVHDLGEKPQVQQQQ